MSEKYPIESYDKYLCLKINDTLWVILLFLLRPYVVTVISLANRTDRTGIINMIYSDKMALWWGILAGVPAFLVIYAWIKRKPGASPFVRKLWHRGRELLLVSALFNMAIVFVPLWMGVVLRVSKAGWIQLALSLGVVVMLYSSSYIRDCFADYPKEADAENS
jgi:Protein of unknown function (DUF2919)